MGSREDSAGYIPVGLENGTHSMVRIIRQILFLCSVATEFLTKMDPSKEQDACAAHSRHYLKARHGPVGRARDVSIPDSQATNTIHLTMPMPVFTLAEGPPTLLSISRLRS